MARYRHWSNSTDPGAVAIASTSVLDFVPIFREPGRAAFMSDISDCIVQACRRSVVCLHAFVIMPEHLYLLIRLPGE